jgi:hypothetical protein
MVSLLADDIRYRTRSGLPTLVYEVLLNPDLNPSSGRLVTT